MYDVLKFLNENIKERLSLEDLSKKFGYSKWYFCTIFKDYVGVSITEYVRHRRIQLATQDIIAGKKIVDIAIDYGYETTDGFNKAFLKEYGCFPKMFLKDIYYYKNLYEERKLKMNHLSDRCNFIKEKLISHSYDNEITGQREYYYYKGIAQLKENMPSNMLLVSSGLACVIKEFPPIIHEGELLVGNNYPINDEKMWFFSIPSSQTRKKELLAESFLTENQINELFINYDIAEKKFNRKRPENTYDWWAPICYETKQDINLIEEMAASGFCTNEAHSVIGYESVLKLGFSGLLKKIIKYEQINGTNDLYLGLKTICHEAMSFGEKYAKEALRLAGIVTNDERNFELLKLAEVCNHVPKNPATSFYEAVQSLLFAHIINTFEDKINANSLGRLDQILYPYYKHDIDNKIITKNQAYEIICCLWLKLYRDYDVQQSCVGGNDVNGNSQVNELSYMMLDATENLDFVRCLSVRYGKNTEKKFIERALEVVGHLQKGVPFFFNDDIMIPALVADNFSFEDACDYTQIGCVETVIPGKSNPHAVTARYNALKALEYVLNRGKSALKPDIAPGIDCGEISKYNTFNKLFDAVKKQIEFLIDRACWMTNSSRVFGNMCPSPFKSLLTEGCLESGKGFNDGGAKYDTYEIMFVGVPNLADSLMAIKKIVYVDKRYSLSELQNILSNNFPDEAVRLDFVNKAPKYGNDLDEVDNLAKEIIDCSCDCLQKMTKK